MQGETSCRCRDADRQAIGATLRAGAAGNPEHPDRRDGLVFRYVNDFHPNQTCAFLTTNLFYAALTGKSPEGFAFDTIVENKVRDGKDPDGGEPKVVFDEKTKTYLQKMALGATRKAQGAPDRKSDVPALCCQGSQSRRPWQETPVRGGYPVVRQC